MPLAFIGDPLRVDLHGDSWVGMAELLANVEDVGSLGQELACESVPQIMEPDRAKICLLQHPLEIPGLHVVNVYEATRAVGEDPRRDFVLPVFQSLLLPLFTQVPQGFQQVVRLVWLLRRLGSWIGTSAAER